MDSVSLQRFNHILTKQISELTQDEISFLRARSGALNPIQLEFYTPLLIQKVKSEEVIEEKPKKTVKKKVETN